MDDFISRPYFEDHEIISLSMLVYTTSLCIVIILMILCVDQQDTNELLIPPSCLRQEDREHSFLHDSNEEDEANNQPS